MAIGNGYMNEKMNIDTSIRFAYGHGLIDEKIWNTLEQECCRGCIDGCDLSELTGQCARLVIIIYYLINFKVEDTFEFLWHGGLNPYDLYRDCDPNPDLNQGRRSVMQMGFFPKHFTQARLNLYSTPQKNVKSPKVDFFKRKTDFRFYLETIFVKKLKKNFFLFF